MLSISRMESGSAAVRQDPVDLSALMAQQLALDRELLEQREGDLFAAFLDLFDHIQAHWGDGKYREMADILRCNRQMQPGVLLNREGPEASLARLRDRVDLSRLDLRTETDLSDIFHLLVSAVAGTLVAAGASSDPAGARARLMRVFGILRRGAASKAVRREEA